MARGFTILLLYIASSTSGIIGVDVVEDMLMATRFGHTVDYILEQIESKSLGAEVVRNSPKNFKRSAFIKENESSCTDNIGKYRCGYLEKYSACITHPKKMKFYCKRTCGFCIPETPECKFTKFGCCHDEKTPAKGYYFKGCPESCLDKNGEPFCKAAERNGLCNSDQRAILNGCKKTCGLCRPCEDEEPLACKAAVFYGLCKKLKFIMLNQCRLTCGFCGKKDPCASFTCPFNEKCIINSYGTPECVCKDACKKGDDLTSIVCGRDGVEYPNLCALKMKSCKGPQVRVNRFGSCKPFAFMEGISCRKARDLLYCKRWKKYGYCKTMKKRMASYCPHECGFCAAKSAMSACQYMKHGCCMDGITPCKGKNYEGCNDREACVDKYVHLCKRFNVACAEDQNKQFMKKFCPATCFYCPRSEKIIR